MRTEYREEPCVHALNRVTGMPFDWSLNPYMGCVHRCAFCYVRAFEGRARRGVGLAARTLDERVARVPAPATAPPRQRLRAVAMLLDAGSCAGVAMARIVPGVSDRPDQLEAVVRAAREAGATHLWAGL